MLKRIFLLLLTIFLFCGCSKNSNCDEIVFSSWGSITETEILKRAISDFEKENPNIKIHFLHIPQNYFQKLHLLFASKTEPDVIFINNLYLPVYKDKLLAIDNLVEKDKYYKQSIEGLSYDKILYGIPRDISNLVFYVNLDILKKANIPLPNSDWKLESLPEIGKNFANKKIYTVSYEDETFWALPYLTYFGGGILDKHSKIIVDKSESQKGINFYKSLQEQYKIAPSKSNIGSSTLAQMFLEQKIVFYLSGRWMYPKIKEKASFNWAIINFPYGKSPLPCDVSGWAISKNTKYPESSLKFIKYLSNQKTSEYFTQTGLIVPARIETSKILDNTKHNEKIFLEVIEHSKNTQTNKNYKKLTDKINKQYLK